MIHNPTKTLDAVVEEINALKEAYALLEAVYVEIGPYKDGKVDAKTWQKVCRYFKFDDSE